MSEQKLYTVYIMTNEKNTTIYIGVTGNLISRIFQHKNKLIDGFTKKYNLIKLVYYETTENAESAIIREKQLKGWLRKKKIDLIKTKNPYFDDLAKDWLHPNQT